MSTAAQRSSMPLLLLAAALLAGCAAEPAGGRVVVQAAGLDPAGISRITVTIASGSDNPFEPIVAELSQDHGAWSCAIDSVPAGAGRQFDVVAYDHGGAALFVSSTRSDVQAGGQLLLALVLNPAPGGGATRPLAASPPVIDRFAVSTSAVAAGARAHLEVEARAPAADPLSYRWSASCGSYDQPAQATTDWTAPPQPGLTCTATATVSNGGGSVAVSVSLFVQ